MYLYSFSLFFLTAKVRKRNTHYNETISYLLIKRKLSVLLRTTLQQHYITLYTAIMRCPYVIFDKDLEQAKERS